MSPNAKQEANLTSSPDKDIESKSEKQWMIVRVHNDTNESLTLRIARVDWGRFFDPDRGTGYVVPNPQGAVAIPGSSFVFGACGRTGVASGTEGAFAVTAPNKGDIVNYYWDCPWGDYVNQFDQKARQRGYVVEDRGANRTNNGALGNIDVYIKPA